jgi:phosphate transport system permease protein
MTAAARQAPVREPRKQRQRRGVRRKTSLFANGEPALWATGAALGLSVAMIVGLLVLVFVQGFSTFWPGRVLRVERVSGAPVMGELSTTERFVPEAAAIAAFDEAAAAAANAAVAALEDGASIRRRRLRTGNFDLTGTHYTWVSDFEIREETRPEWALVVERLGGWGRFYGEPRAFFVDGEQRTQAPDEAWALFEEHHEASRRRFRERRALETSEVGRVNRRQETARLALASVELEHGQDSAEWQREKARHDAMLSTTNAEFTRLRDEIEALDRENARYEMLLATADGQEKRMVVGDIVRAYPANQVGFVSELGIYLSRWREFLFDEPRNANNEGGVYPAIFGTVSMTLIMSLLVVPFGVLAALYLREYAKQGLIVSTVRVAVNNLAGVPSIVFGVFGLGFFCYIIGASIDELFFAAKLPDPTYGKGGILWASLTLALLTLPVVIVATEEAIAAVPSSMREGSYACGATKWQTIRRIVLPKAAPGIMTGMILAIARGAGEVAPLMLVGAMKVAEKLPIDGTPPFVHPERSFMHLGFHIYDLGFQSQNSEAAKPMVYTTTLLLILIVVLLNLLAIWIRARLRARVAGTYI